MKRNSILNVFSVPLAILTIRQWLMNNSYNAHKTERERKLIKRGERKIGRLVCYCRSVYVKFSLLECDKN